MAQAAAQASQQGAEQATPPGPDGAPFSTPPVSSSIATSSSMAKKRPLPYPLLQSPLAAAKWFDGDGGGGAPHEAAPVEDRTESVPETETELVLMSPHDWKS